MRFVCVFFNINCRLAWNSIKWSSLLLLMLWIEFWGFSHALAYKMYKSKALPSSSNEQTSMEWERLLSKGLPSIRTSPCKRTQYIYEHIHTCSKANARLYRDNKIAYELLKFHGSITRETDVAEIFIHLRHNGRRVFSLSHSSTRVWTIAL